MADMEKAGIIISRVGLVLSIVVPLAVLAPLMLMFYDIKRYSGQAPLEAALGTGFILLPGVVFVLSRWTFGKPPRRPAALVLGWIAAAALMICLAPVATNFPGLIETLATAEGGRLGKLGVYASFVILPLIVGAAIWHLARTTLSVWRKRP